VSQDSTYPLVVIYCVVPAALEDELFDKLIELCSPNPDVKVILDRRHFPDRRRRVALARQAERRQTRDRRRTRIPGCLPKLDAQGLRLTAAREDRRH
jgi:hypothetical protein